MGRRVDEWDDEPTVNESKHDTAPHDLTGLARASVGDPGLVFGEGIEEAIRALYVVMRKRGRGMPRIEMDAIVAAVRAEVRRP